MPDKPAMGRPTRCAKAKTPSTKGMTARKLRGEGILEVRQLAHLSE